MTYKKTLIAVAVGLVASSAWSATVLDSAIIGEYPLTDDTSVTIADGYAAQDATVRANGFDLSLTRGSGSGAAYDLTVTGTDGTESVAIRSENGTAIFTGPTNLTGLGSVVIYGSSKGIQGYSTVVISAKSIDISGGDDAIQFQSDCDGSVMLKDFETLTITGGEGYALQNAHATGSIVIEGAEGSVVNITGSSRTAIRSQGADSSISITAGEVNISGNPTAEKYYGSVYVDAGSVTINSDKVSITDSTGTTTSAIYATGGSLSIAGLTEDSTPELTVSGDVTLSGTAATKLDFSGSSSSLTGAINSTSTGTSNVSFTDGAVWNVTDSSDLSSTTALTLSDAVVNVADASTTVSVASLSGTGGTVNLAAAVADDGSVSSAKLIATQAAAETNLAVGYTGVTADDMSESAFAALVAESVSGVAATASVAEGDVNGAYTTSVAADGSVTASSAGENTKLRDLRGSTAASLVLWRDQINHLTKRLGDLRAGDGTYGAWARIYGKESKWGSGASAVELTTTSVEVGGDVRVSDWVVGGAFNYTDTDYDLANGDGEGDTYGLAVYGSRLFESGAFIDLVARYGYIKNEIVSGNMRAKTDSSAFSVSAEAGHHFRFAGMGYVEPQIEITYGYAIGDDVTASNGVKIDQDDYQSLVARIGGRAGFDFPEKAGTLYATLSYSYDFLGEAEGTATSGSNVARIDTDLGGGWWTYGVGAQFAVGKSAFAYGELERTTGGEVRNPWAFNVGFRYVW